MADARRHAGTHITGERLRKRLKPYGITSRAGRQARYSRSPHDYPHRSSPSALASTKRALPKWVRAAGATYADYVALRSPP